MNDLDLLLRRWLPRPGPDPAFRVELREALLAGHPLSADPSEVPGRRRLYYVGGAVVGAAALAVGALGWLRFRGSRASEAA